MPNTFEPIDYKIVQAEYQAPSELMAAVGGGAYYANISQMMSSGAFSLFHGMRVLDISSKLIYKIYNRTGAWTSTAGDWTYTIEPTPIINVLNVSSGEIGNFSAVSASSFSGVALVQGGMYLVKDQTTKTDNGIYIASTVSGGVATFTRDTEISFTYLPRTLVYVPYSTANTTNTGCVYRCKGGDPAGADAYTFERDDYVNNGALVKTTNSNVLPTNVLALANTYSFITQGGDIATIYGGNPTFRATAASGNVTSSGTVAATALDISGVGEFGANAGTLGKVTLYGSTSGYISIQPTVNPTSYTLILPGTAGSNGQVLSTNGSGTLSWITKGSGTVTTVSVVPANGVSGSVANATTTPAITLTLGDITPNKVNGNTITTGTGTLTLGSGTLEIVNAASNTFNTLAVATSFLPVSTDTVPLGSVSKTFSDLYLGNGAVIDYNNSNVVLTHSSGILTLGTGTLKITNPTNTTTSVVTIDGTQTLTNKAINSPTINSGATLTTTSTKLNYLTSATGTTGTTTSNVVFSASPSLTGTTTVENLDITGNVRSIQTTATETGGANAVLNVDFSVGCTFLKNPANSTDFNITIEQDETALKAYAGTSFIISVYNRNSVSCIVRFADAVMFGVNGTSVTLATNEGLSYTGWICEFIEAGGSVTKAYLFGTVAPISGNLMA